MQELSLGIPRFAYLGAILVLIGAAGCGASKLASPDEKPEYLRYVAFEAPGNEHVLLRWPTRKMPLKIYLPKPPEGLFDDPEALWDAARRGVLAWKDAAGAGLPAFDFVESASEADIPIAWSETATDFSIAHCFYNVAILQRRFDVAQVVVTGRFSDGREAPPELIGEVVTHEVGHALGLGGHSPNPEDMMYGFVDAGVATSGPGVTTRELSPRDRETIRLLYQRPIGAGIRGARRAY